MRSASEGSASNNSFDPLSSKLQDTTTSTMTGIWSLSKNGSSSRIDINASSTFTLSSSNISTTAEVPHSKDDSGLISAGTALVIFLLTLFLIVIGSMLLYYLRKKRNLSCKQCKCKCCLPRRRRRSSTSSQGPLTQDDATFVNILDRPRQERELFSIGDQDGGDDGRPRSRQRQGTEDDYFYDEIFEKSAFVDETTNKANTHLTVDDELSELNIPDLVFKKPSTRI